MANTSIVTQEMLQDTLQNYHENLVYPFLNGSANLGFTPIGTVISVMSNEAPDNYLVCDGTAYNISDYSDLANFFEEQFGSKNYFGGNGTTTFAVPDLRGEFLRGSGTNLHTNQGSGANVGVHQDATETVNIEAYYSPNDNKSVITATRYGSLNDNDYYTKNADSTLGNAVYGGGISGSVGNWGSAYNKITSRPTNTSVLYCIAYKNIYISAGVGGYPVEVTNPQDKQGLQFDAANNKWVNGDDYHKYSTSEHIVGEWIDGRPIYEKTIDCGALPNTAAKNINISTLNINNVIKITGMAYRPSDNTQIPLPYTAAGAFTNATVSLDYENGLISIGAYMDRTAFTKSYVTIQYTKTTS